MSRPQSDATQITSLRRQLREAERDMRTVESQRDVYRTRATKAEQEAAEWKARFDILLSRDPKGQS